MSLRSLLVSIIVAGVCAGLLVVDLALSGGAERAGPDGVETLGIAPGDVVRVEIRRGDGGGPETVERVPGRLDDWVIGRGTPNAWAARPQRVGAVLRELSTTRLENATDSAGEAAFRDSGRSVSLVRRDGSVVRLVFGEGAAGGRVPVRIESRDADDIATGRRFAQTTSRLRALTDAGVVEGWRREALFGLAAARVRSVKLAAGPMRVALGRAGSGWRVEDPIRIDADPERVDGVLRSVLSLRASSFVREGAGDDALFGLEEPRASIEIGWGVPEAHTAWVEIGAPSTEGRVYAGVTRSDLGSRVIVELDAASIGSLTATPIAYARATASTIGASRVSSLTLSGPGGDEIASAARDVDAWSRVSGATLPSGVAEGLVSVAARVRSGDVAAPGTVDPDASVLRLEIAGSGARALFGIVISGDGARLTLVRLDGEERGFAWTFGGSGVSELIASLWTLVPS